MKLQVITTTMMHQRELFLSGQLVLKVLEPQWGRLHPLMLGLVFPMLLLV
jgi:hypothetical protein